MKEDRFLVALQKAIEENNDFDILVPFKNDVPREVWNFTNQFYLDTGTLPSITILRERFSFSLPSQTPYSFYLKEREDEIFVEKATPLLERFNNNSTNDFKSSLIQLKEELAQLSEPTSFTGHSLKNSIQQRIEHFTQSAPQRLRIGIAPIDEATGGLEQDEFFVISARLGIGKSWIAQFIAAEVAKQGKTVLFYSGEMTTEQVGSRIDTIWANGNISNYLYTRNRLTEQEKESLVQTVQQVAGDIIIFTPKDLPHSTCRPSDVRRFIKGYQPDLVILDQLSLMEPDGNFKNSSEAERKAQLSYQLKTVQEQEPIPFILVSQLNRQAQQEEATAANIAGSDRIGQDASLVIALKRKEDKLRISILKARSFKPQDGLLELQWDVDRGQLTPVLSGMDAVRAAASQARARDEVRSREEEQTATEEDLTSWEE